MLLSFSLQPAGVSMASKWCLAMNSYYLFIIHACFPAPMLLQDEDKLVPVDSHKLFAISGEAGDRVNFSEYIIANVRRGSWKPIHLAAWRSALPGSFV